MKSSFNLLALAAICSLITAFYSSANAADQAPSGSSVQVPIFELLKIREAELNQAQDAIEKLKKANDALWERVKELQAELAACKANKERTSQ